jgi:hypothetical protein
MVLSGRMRQLSLLVNASTLSTLPKITGFKFAINEKTGMNPHWKITLQPSK